MGTALPFSAIDKYLGGLEMPIPGCLVDTQFLVATTEELHPFFDDAKFLFEKLAEYQVPIFTTVTTRAEYIDIRRRFIVTEVLMDMLATESKWEISDRVRKVLRAHKTWIDARAADESLPILPDHRIKGCKENFMPRNHSGQIGWIALCREYLHGELVEAWNIIVNQLGLNYVDMRNASVVSLIPQKLEWDKMYRISEETCLASNDAMLVNVLNCSKFPFIASADFDLAYAVLAGSSDKIVLVPDNLHYKKVKSLKF